MFGDENSHVEYAESEWLSGYIPNLWWIVGIHPWTPSCILTMDNSSFEWEIVMDRIICKWVMFSIANLPAQTKSLSAYNPH